MRARPEEARMSADCVYLRLGRLIPRRKCRGLFITRGEGLSMGLEDGSCVWPLSFYFDDAAGGCLRSGCWGVDWKFCVSTSMLV